VFDEAASHGPGDARLREPASARSAFDESSTREPVEVLIKEARNRARKRRLVIGAVAAATVAGAAIAVTAALDGGPPQSQGAAVDSPAWPMSFGVFEPARGRIVYTDGPGMSDVAATWSPDGAQIAAIDFAPSGRRLVVMGSDGSASRVLADLPANDLFTGVAWHPGPRGR